MSKPKGGRPKVSREVINLIKQKANENPTWGAPRIHGELKSDHMIVMNENHLRSILNDYVSYYNKYRTHIGINKDSPEGRPIQTEGMIYKVPAVNGLHHVYFRHAT